MQAFITQDSADRDYLFKNLRSFDVAVINHVADAGRTPEPLHISQEACDVILLYLHTGFMAPLFISILMKLADVIHGLIFEA